MHILLETRLAVTHLLKFWRVLLIFFAFSSKVVHLSDALVANLVRMTSISHVRDAHLCVIINTGRGGSFRALKMSSLL